MTAVAKVVLKHVQAFRDRHGKMRYYFRRRGYAKVPLPGLPGSTEFAKAYQAALKAQRRQIVSPTEGPNSMGALIAEYYASADYKAKAPKTKSTYRGLLEKFREAFGKDQAADFTHIHLNAIFHKMSDTPAQASNLRKRLRKVFQVGVRLGWIDINPVRETEKIAYKVKGFTPWPDEAIAAFRARWPSGTPQRLAMELLYWTGVRRSDAVTLGRQHLKSGLIGVVQEKTDVRVWLPIHPLLQAELDLVPAGQLTFILTVYGKPRTEAGFTKWFGEMADAAGATDLTPHGLRKALGRHLAEAESTEKEIAAALGQSSPASAAVYTKDANRDKLAASAHRKLRAVEG